MLMVHLANDHVAPTGYIMFPGNKNALHGDPEKGMPMEYIAKGTVMQMATNLSVYKLREDIVYENCNVNTFACQTLIQPRNKENFQAKDAI